VILRIVPKAGNEFKQEKIDHLRAKESQKFDPAFGAMFINTVVSVFKEPSRNFIYIFLIIQSRIKI
jgi:hypothetical protein